MSEHKRTCGSETCRIPEPENVVGPDQKLPDASFLTGEFVIPVKFIHLQSGSGDGAVTAQQRQEQIDVLNNAYQGFGISFVYRESDVLNVRSNEWYQLWYGSEEEVNMKTALHSDPDEFLNFYTCDAGNLLGWATFPWEKENLPQMDGIIVLNEALPGGDASPFNLGGTAVHEVGHWLGLFHTFQGGCSVLGDSVDDTIAHAYPNYGKPDPAEANGACIEGELAPVHNYMNYTDDAWMTEFTTGQIDRVKLNLYQYRKDFYVTKSEAVVEVPTETPKEGGHIYTTHLDLPIIVAVGVGAAILLRLLFPGRKIVIKNEAPAAAEDPKD